MRDAMVAALSLNVFQRHTDRVKMANIAQVVNVLQSMILTDTVGTGRMVLTPTYHVFQMYKDFQEATYLPMDVKTDSIDVEGDHMYQMKAGKIPAVSLSAARKTDGTIVVSLVNPSLDKAQQVEFTLEGASPKTASGSILSGKNMTDYNDFDNPGRIRPTLFKDVKIKKNNVRLTVPAKSIIVVTLK